MKFWKRFGLKKYQRYPVNKMKTFFKFLSEKYNEKNLELIFVQANS